MAKDTIIKIVSSRRLYVFVRIGLAALFLYGGAVKLMDPGAFARVIDAYGLVPEAMLPFVAVSLPILEVAAGLALLLDRREGLAVITGLLLLFVAVLGYGVWQDLDVDCGCFSQEELASRDGLRNALYRDIFLVGVVIPFLYLSRWMRKPLTENHTMKGDSVKC